MGKKNENILNRLLSGLKESGGFDEEMIKEFTKNYENMINDFLNNYNRIYGNVKK